MALEVYSEDGELRATCTYAEDAGALVSFLGDGSTIREGKKVLWKEGEEEQSAGESYDFVAETVWRRLP